MPFFGIGIKTDLFQSCSTPEFSKFALILSAALSQHHLLGLVAQGQRICCQCRRCRRCEFNPCAERFPGEGNDNPLHEQLSINVALRRGLCQLCHPHIKKSRCLTTVTVYWMPDTLDWSKVRWVLQVIHWLPCSYLYWQFYPMINEWTILFPFQNWTDYLPRTHWCPTYRLYKVWWDL